MGKKYPSRANIPALPTEISKWQKASVELVHLKFKIHNILNEFTTEERQSDQYKELTDILKGIIVHVIDDNGEHGNTTAVAPVIVQNINTVEPPKKNKLKEMAGKYWNFQTLVVGIISAIAVAIAPHIVEIIKTIATIIMGTP